MLYFFIKYCFHSIVIDGAPGNWTEWTTCSKTCGTGSSYRERSCNSPVAQNGGKDCLEEELTEAKNMQS